MWQEKEEESTFPVETFTVPSSGIVDFKSNVPFSLKVNDMPRELQHLHLSENDVISFYTNSDKRGTISILGNGFSHTFVVGKKEMQKASEQPQKEGEVTMSNKDKVNIFTNPEPVQAGGMGLGAAGGGVAGLALGAVGGYLAGEAVNNRFENIYRDSGDIKQAIAVGAGNNELVTAEAVSTINSANAAQTLGLTQALDAQTLGIVNKLSSMSQDGYLQTATIKDTVVALSNENLRATTATNIAVEREAAATRATVLADGAATRLLIEANRAADLQARVIALEADGRSRGIVEQITINNTNTNTQMQMQQQQQQIALLASGVNSLLAQNQTIHQGIVNLGTMTGNTQSAANTRVQ